jgi:hypothetical protein
MIPVLPSDFLSADRLAVPWLPAAGRVGLLRIAPQNLRKNIVNVVLHFH